jgi:hypothetical protein
MLERDIAVGAVAAAIFHLAENSGAARLHGAENQRRYERRFLIAGNLCSDGETKCWRKAQFDRVLVRFVKGQLPIDYRLAILAGSRNSFERLRGRDDPVAFRGVEREPALRRCRRGLCNLLNGPERARRIKGQSSIAEFAHREAARRKGEESSLQPDPDSRRGISGLIEDDTGDSEKKGAQQTNVGNDDVGTIR